MTKRFEVHSSHKFVTLTFALVRTIVALYTLLVLLVLLIWKTLKLGNGNRCVSSPKISSPSPSLALADQPLWRRCNSSSLNSPTSLIPGYALMPSDGEK